LPETIEHKYSKTFNYKWKPFGYHPEVVVEEVNGWLDAQVGLTNLTMSFHIVPSYIIRGVTLNCTAVAAPMRHRAQVDRVVLATGAFLRHRTDLGTALNQWGDTYPGRRRMNYWVLNSRGVATEAWLLYSEPRAAPLHPDSGSADTPERFT
jgi:hypothetical protein